MADPESLQRGRCGEWPNGTRGGSGEGLCPSPEKKRNLALALRILVYSDNPTYANIMFITACNERENSPQSLYDIRLTVLPRDAMRRAVFAVSWCPSVRLFVRPPIRHDRRLQAINLFLTALRNPKQYCQ